MFRFAFRLLLLTVFLTVLLPAAAEGTSSDLTVIIPAIKVQASVVSIPLVQFPDGTVTWETQNLRGTVGYFAGTAWFGEPGRVVLGGHARNTRRRPDVFYKLEKLQPGDEVIVSNGSQEWHYQVVEISVVDEFDLSVLQSNGSEQLVLMTCDLTSQRSSGTYSRRVVVIASRI